MSLKYLGNKCVRDKITELLNEMIEDEELCYTVNIYENRENEKITKLLIEVSDIKKEEDYE